MAEGSSNAARVLRFLISGGWAEEDAEVVRELLERARELASLAVADDGASADAVPRRCGPDRAL